MRAILFRRSSYLSIYSLEQDERTDEVRSFLSGINDPVDGGYVRGFIQIVNRIAEGAWPLLPNEQKKCWEQDGFWLCELRKGCWRISCFTESGRLVLGTVFRKSKNKQKKEYNRAVSLFRRFINNPDWEEG